MERNISNEDFNQLIDLYVNYFNADGISKWTREIAYKRLAQIKNMDDSIFIIEKQENHILGFLMGYYEWYDDGPMLHIVEALVFSEYQNKGIGKQLFLEAEKLAFNFGCERIFLECLDDDLHNHFYGSLGYHNHSKLIYKVKEIKI